MENEKIKSVLEKMAKLLEDLEAEREKSATLTEKVEIAHAMCRVCEVISSYLYP